MTMPAADLAPRTGMGWTGLASAARPLCPSAFSGVAAVATAAVMPHASARAETRMPRCLQPPIKVHTITLLLPARRKTATRRETAQGRLGVRSHLILSWQTEWAQSLAVGHYAPLPAWQIPHRACLQPTRGGAFRPRRP